MRLSPILLAAGLLALAGCGTAAGAPAAAPAPATTATTLAAPVPTVTNTVPGPTVTKTVSGPSTTVAVPVPEAPAASPPAVPAPANCDPAYPDTCLTDGIGDYDCAGGTGNGPNYVTGPITVRYPDPFGLDSDGNGIGCETAAAGPSSEVVWMWAPKVATPAGVTVHVHTSTSQYATNLGAVYDSAGIVCSAPGETVSTGYAGSSSNWDYVTYPAAGWVADVFLDTRTPSNPSGAVAPRC